MPAHHPLGYSPGGQAMHSLLAGEALLLRVQRLTVPPPWPKDFQHRMCSQLFPNVGLASLYMSHLGPVPMQARLGACLRQALHGQDWALWKQWRPTLLSWSRNNSTVSRCMDTQSDLAHLWIFRILWPLCACPWVPATIPLSWFCGDTHIKQVVMGPSLESWLQLISVSDWWWGPHLNPGRDWLPLVAGGWPTFSARCLSSLALSLPCHTAHRWLECPLPPGSPPPAYLDVYCEAQFYWESTVLQ